jgi:predicted unusual protein kinase regulating ubiquinone biosynthesis (AarF/ABC1/UbiB family)
VLLAPSAAATQSDAYLCYKEAFKDFTSSAPAESWASILQVFREEFGGRHPSQVFQKFEQTPIASASIAQVRLSGPPFVLRSL